MGSIELALRAVGAFYVFAGILLARQLLGGHLLDRALASVTLKPSPKLESARTLWLLSSSALVLLGGLLLVWLIDLAAWVFAASFIHQAAYLLLLAPRWFDAVDPPEPAGRRATRNAFLVYGVATVAVWGSLAAGRLSSWSETPPAVRAVVVAGVALHLAFAGWHFARPLGSRKTS